MTAVFHTCVHISSFSQAANDRQYAELPTTHQRHEKNVECTRNATQEATNYVTLNLHGSEREIFGARAKFCLVEKVFGSN